MPPETYSDDNGNKVVVRHKGPAGRGIPAGGTAGKVLVKSGTADFETAWATPPNGTDAVTFTGEVPVSGNLAIFDGITGKVIKDSTRALSYFATANEVSLKQNKVAGKGLSTEDYTTPEKVKLAGLFIGGFRGTFANYAALLANDFNPVPRAGDYCHIASTGIEVVEVLWDTVNAVWTQKATPTLNLVGNEIATALFASADAPGYDKETCRIFTSGEKSQIADLAALATSLGATATPPVAAYGAFSYFDLVGSSVGLPSVSDGLSNMVKPNPTTTFLGVSSLFTSPSNARLTYTGTADRLCLVTAKVAVGNLNSKVLVFGIAKSGNIIPSSRQLQVTPSTGATTSVTLSAIVSLVGGDYLEVFIGNTTDSTSPNIRVLSLEATSL